MRGPSPIDTPPGWSLNAQLPFDYPVSRAILRTSFGVIYGTLTATQAGNGICTVRAGPAAGASAGDGQASATTRPAFCTAATSHPSAPVPGASAIAKCRGQPPPTDRSATCSRRAPSSCTAKDATTSGPRTLTRTRPPATSTCAGDARIGDGDHVGAYPRNHAGGRGAQERGARISALHHKLQRGGRAL